MTRRSDLMCEDIFGCTHKPEIPIVDDDSNDILFWLCRCGSTKTTVESIRADNAKRAEAAKL